jgi:hypothetical protein
LVSFAFDAGAFPYWLIAPGADFAKRTLGQFTHFYRLVATLLAGITIFSLYLLHFSHRKMSLADFAISVRVKPNFLRSSSGFPDSPNRSLMPILLTGTG